MDFCLLAVITHNQYFAVSSLLAGSMSTRSNERLGVFQRSVSNSVYDWFTVYAKILILTKNSTKTSICHRKLRGQMLLSMISLTDADYPHGYSTPSSLLHIPCVPKSANSVQVLFNFDTRYMNELCFKVSLT